MAIIKAWFTLPEHMEPGDQNNPEKLHYSNLDMEDVGWLHVADANIELINIRDHKQIVENMVNTLQSQLQKELADSQMRQNEIKSRINNLLAIAHDVDGVDGHGDGQGEVKP